MKKEINEGQYWKLIQIALGSHARMGGLAGQAFTSYRCLMCLEPFSHPNTMTPHFCPTCTKLASEECKKRFEDGFFSKWVDEGWDILEAKHRAIKELLFSKSEGEK